MMREDGGSCSSGCRYNGAEFVIWTSDSCELPSPPHGPPSPPISPPPPSHLHRHPHRPPLSRPPRSPLSSPPLPTAHPPISPPPPPPLSLPPISIPIMKVMDLMKMTGESVRSANISLEVGVGAVLVCVLIILCSCLLWRRRQSPQHAQVQLTQELMTQQGVDTVENGGGGQVDDDDNDRCLHTSFASSDAMHAMKYRDMVSAPSQLNMPFPHTHHRPCTQVDKHTDGWTMYPLVPPGISDGTWFARWKRGVERADGVLIIFTDAYRHQAMTGGPHCAIHIEAQAILTRWRRDHTFKVYALNPSHPGEDYANLRFQLQQVDLLGMNADRWIEFITGTRHRRPSFWQRFTSP